MILYRISSNCIKKQLKTYHDIRRMAFIRKQEREKRGGNEKGKRREKNSVKPSVRLVGRTIQRCALVRRPPFAVRIPSYSKQEGNGEKEGRKGGRGGGKNWAVLVHRHKVCFFILASAERLSHSARACFFVWESHVRVSSEGRGEKGNKR